MPRDTQEILEVLNRAQATRKKRQEAAAALENITAKLELPKLNYGQPVGTNNIRPDRVGHAVEAREPYIDEIRAAEIEYRGAVIEAARLIEKVKDTRSYSVLSARYIQGKAWEEIAESMNCSKRSIFRLRDNGLREILDATT